MKTMKLMLIILSFLLIGCYGNPPLKFGKVQRVLKTDKGCTCYVALAYETTTTDNQIWKHIWIECPDTTQVNDWMNFQFRDYSKANDTEVTVTGKGFIHQNNKN